MSPPGNLRGRLSRSWPLALLWTGLAGGAAAVLFLFNPGDYSFYPYCLFHRLTGWLCPGCGSLRAMHCLVHADVEHALRFNLLFVGALPFLLAWLTRRTIRRWRGSPVQVRLKPAWLWTGLAIVVLFGVARNLPFAQQLWLAPALP